MRLHRAVDRFPESASYHPCLLLISEQINALNIAGERLSQHYDLPLFSIGEILSTTLQSFPPQQRPKQVRSTLQSAIAATRADLLDCVENEAVRQAATAIAGRFNVARVEIGSVEKGLRDILLDELQDTLANWGIDYQFPPSTTLTNNKDVLVEAMGLFQEAYPQQGLLLVVDELLDYLRERTERELIGALGFLRELGEVVALTPLRFIGGLQETLFENPRFSFVAEQLRRVKDRFEQVRIVREDVAYVVSHRLLRKSDAQLAQITEHLRRFTPLFNSLAERLEQFAALFPVHPAYIETFEHVYVAEKREILKTLSRAMSAMLDEELPPDQPGLLSYDHYWAVLNDNPTMRSLPGVSDVVEKSNVLEGRISHGFSRPHLLPMARRIIHALSVHRLTTGDIRLPIGVTAEELRDDLCLYVELPEASAEFLLGQVQITLREISRAVSGQFISHNQENGQYYLDVDKVIDFDARIADRGQSLGNDELNRYFFDALRQALSLSDTTYVTNFRIWFYELPWPAKNVTRPGYLFFGPPNERSTAQPPRDFYIYLLPPFGPTPWSDEERPDEVIFELRGLDQSFTDTVRTFAGARALSQESAEHRQVYADKAAVQLRDRLLPWLRQNLVSRLHVTHQGHAQPVVSAIPALASSASHDLEELLSQLAGHFLQAHFAERYPKYPAFTRLRQPVTAQSLAVTAMEAVRALARGARTDLALAVLSGLQLVDDDGLTRPYNSPYAQYILELLHQKTNDKQVVNRGELIETVTGGVAQPIEKDIAFRLEPEWIVVVLIALIHHGDIVLNVDGRDNIDAGNIEKAAILSMEQLVVFRYYRRPKSLDIAAWSEIFKVLDLPAGLIRDEVRRNNEAVPTLQNAVCEQLNRLATLQGQLQRGLSLWNSRLFTDRDTIQVQAGMVVCDGETPQVEFASTDLTGHLRRHKEFLEKLTRFDTVGKLRNLDLTLADAHHAREDRQVVARAAQLLEIVNNLQPVTAYLAVAQANLPASHEWVQRAQGQRQDLIDSVRRMGKGQDSLDLNSFLRGLEQLKRDYIQEYARLHRQMVLSHAGDERRRCLYDDPRLKALKQLAAVDLLPGSELAAWEEAISAIPSSRTFHDGVLQEEPTHEGFRPAQHRNLDYDANERLQSFDQRLDDILQRWQQALRAGLTSAAARESLNAMTQAERAPIEAFLARTDRDPAIPQEFATAANRALRGIQLLELSIEEMLAALKTGGLPATVEDLEKRFKGFVNKKMRGHDPRNTRLTLSETQG